MTQFGLRNILLGFIHLIDFEIYRIKISLLFIIELFFFLFGLKVISLKNIFQYKTNAWINLLATFIRLMILAIFYC